MLHPLHIVYMPKKVILFGEHLCHEILYPVPHRQYVFSIPKILRVYFKYDRKLLGKLCQCANASLLTFLRTATGIEDGVLGAVMTIHNFGDYCRWHPHGHGIVADGLFYGNGMKSFQLVRYYYGFYSNRARGERRKEAERASQLTIGVTQ